VTASVQHAPLHARLGYCRNLPSPPGIALRILELAQDPGVEAAAVAEVVGMDAALSARVLRIANSPLYATRRRIESLGQALTLLGLNATLSLALGFSLTPGLRGPAGKQDWIWRRSVIAALACRLLGQWAGLRKVEDLMLAGLLQDIGVLALLQLFPDDYPAVLAGADSNAHLLQLERERFGIDHAEAGAELAAQWRLPDYLQLAIRASESCAGDDRFQACVCLSGRVADLWLADDGDVLRPHVLAEARDALGLDARSFDGVLERMSAALPDINALFDVQISEPEHIRAILEHADELATLRRLRELQAAVQLREAADEAERRASDLAEQVRRDPLTGIFSRKHLELVLEREFQRANDTARPLSIAFIDLDDFKKVNDAHGHPVGDQVLRSTAQALQRLIRSEDTLARYGGEEFLLMLVDTDEDVARSVVERLLAAIAPMSMATVDGVPVKVTFSAGLATHGSSEYFQTAAELLKAADEAVYGAKRTGRNRVVATGA